MYRKPANPPVDAFVATGASTDAALMAAMAALERRNQELEEALTQARREIARLLDVLEARDDRDDRGPRPK